jgi:hypothetical protein
MVCSWEKPQFQKEAISPQSFGSIRPRSRTKPAIEHSINHFKRSVGEPKYTINTDEVLARVTIKMNSFKYHYPYCYCQCLWVLWRIRQSKVLKSCLSLCWFKWSPNQFWYLPRRNLWWIRQCPMSSRFDLFDSKGLAASAGTCQLPKSNVCGGFANVQCPKGLNCLNSKGEPASTGTCQKIECPAFKCADPPCNKKRTTCKITDNFMDNGCKTCPTGVCKKKNSTPICWASCAAMKCNVGTTCTDKVDSKTGCQTGQCVEAPVDVCQNPCSSVRCPGPCKNVSESETFLQVWSQKRMQISTVCCTTNYISIQSYL